MKKRFVVMISILLAALMTLSACVSLPDLNEEENEMVSEYAASLLLKYDSDNHSRLVDTSEFMKQYETAVKVREDGIRAYEAAKQKEEDDRRKEAEAQEALNNRSDSDSASSSNGSSGGDGSGGATVVDNSEPVVTIEEFLNATNYSIEYAEYRLLDSYPEESTDYFFSMDATSGNKLMVIFFNVTNNGSASQLNVYAEGVTFKVNVNGQGYKSVYKTMLQDDLSEYLGDFAAGESRRLVLIYEVPTGTTISSLSLMVSSNSRGSTTENLIQ